MSTIAQAQDLDAQFKAGNLSASEYKELLEDLRHTAAVNEAAGDLNKIGPTMKSNQIVAMYVTAINGRHFVVIQSSVFFSAAVTILS